MVAEPGQNMQYSSQMKFNLLADRKALLLYKVSLFALQIHPQYYKELKYRETK